MVGGQGILFFVTAALAGAINAVAGGGSFLLFPILMFGGMSPVAANIMCTVAMLPGSVVSSIAYWHEIKTPISTLTKLLVIGVVGSAIGSATLLYFPEETFAALVPWLLLAATIIFTFGRKMIALIRLNHTETHRLVIYAGMLAIAIYGGYFGAGMGILLLAMLQLAGYSHMHEMNAMKALLGSALSLSGAIVFIGSGHVLWEWAPVLILGGMTGGYIGTRLALKLHPESVRQLVVMIAVAMTIYFFIR